MTDNLVKPIAGILTSRTDVLEGVLEMMEPLFGDADIRGELQPFTHTDYYGDEMGAGLSRCFVSFAKIVPGEAAAGFKQFAQEIECRFSAEGRRIVNIDPGYLDQSKLVLLSGKYGGHKVALAPGVYADVLLWYNKGWQPMPWAFPDFRDGSLFLLFTKMRLAFKRQRS
ncbi:MAG: DUF4416 family protein [Proteobacteria bacterium]|nr:DUF4416 family protein [Pseudomonadota bacterium]